MAEIKPTISNTATRELILALTVANTCGLNGKSRFSFTLPKTTTAANTIIETENINVFAFLSFFLIDADIIAFVFYFV